MPENHDPSRSPAPPHQPSAHAGVYWTVQQAIDWSRCRDAALVEQSSGVNRDALDVKVAMATSKAKAKGRDLKAELWRASAWAMPSPPGEIRAIPFTSRDPVEDLDTITVFDVKMEGRTLEFSNVREEAQDRLRVFPIKDYLTWLARQGRLTALGKRPPPRRGGWEPLPPHVWNDLEIRYRGEIPVAAATLFGEEGEYYLVQFLRADVLREFPASLVEPQDDSAARQPTDEEVDEILRDFEGRERKIPSQKACFKKVRDTSTSSHGIKRCFQTQRQGLAKPKNNCPELRTFPGVWTFRQTRLFAY
jgi:hypothetical protein